MLFDLSIYHSIITSFLEAYGETLAAELRPFNIRVTVIAPGSFRTSAPYDLRYPLGQPIHDSIYTQIRSEMAEAQRKRFKKVQEKADPERGMDLVIDLVLGEGRAGSLARGEGHGDGWPMWLFLGRDGMKDLRKRMGTMERTMEVWEEVGSDVAFSED